MRTLIVILLVGCGSARGADAGADAGRTDAGPVFACPAGAPADGDACDEEGARCTWALCPSRALVVTVACGGGAWTITEVPCDEHPCGDASCPAQHLCVVRQGGALLHECVPNPCDEGPIEAACACEPCGGGQCTLTGREVTCRVDCGAKICP